MPFLSTPEELAMAVLKQVKIYREVQGLGLCKWLVLSVATLSGA